MSEAENKDNQEEEMELVPDEGGDLPDLKQKIKEVKGDLKKCESERKEYLEGWQRAKADFINYKKDEGKRFEDMARYVTAGFLNEVLPVLDSFDLALNHQLSAGAEKGILLIRSQFEDVLKRRGLFVMEVEPGEDFNPEKHESIGEVESDFAEGKVAEVVQRGYLFLDKVLRPARVKLAK